MRCLALLLVAGGCVRSDVDADADGPVDSDTPGETDSELDASDSGRVDTAREPVECPRNARPPAAASAVPGFRPFRPQVLTPESIASVVVEDLDRDGRLDLALLGGEGDRLLDVRFGTGAPPWLGDPVSLGAPPLDGAVFRAIAPHDVDDDGDLDLIGATSKGIVAAVLDDGTFTWRIDVAPAAEGIDPTWSVPTWLAVLDLDGDGVLDLLQGASGSFLRYADDGALVRVYAPPADQWISASVHCYQGVGDGTFAPAASGLCPAPVLPGFAVESYGAGIADLTGDGAPEVVLVNDFGKNVVLRGTGDGLAPHPGSGIDVYNHAMGVGVADFDGDGLRDVFVTDVGPNSLYVASGDDCLRFFDAMGPSGLMAATERSVTWGVVAQDLDHNGAPDLLVAQTAEFRPEDELDEAALPGLRLPYPPTLLLMNQGEGLFTRFDVPSLRGAGIAVWQPSTMAHGDLDGDGDIDGVLATAYGASVLWNELPKVGAALTVLVLDDLGRPAIGARVVVRQISGSRRAEVWPTSNLQGSSQLAVHVGLGTVDEPVTVDVRWPDGRRSAYGPFTTPFPQPWTLTARPPGAAPPSP